MLPGVLFIGCTTIFLCVCLCLAFKLTASRFFATPEACRAFSAFAAFAVAAASPCLCDNGFTPLAAALLPWPPLFDAWPPPLLLLP